jgi:hypothetical protein
MNPTCRHGISIAHGCFACASDFDLDELLNPGGQQAAGAANDETDEVCAHGVSMEPWVTCEQCDNGEEGT